MLPGLLLLLLLRVVASRRAASLEPQLCKAYLRDSWPPLSTSMAQRSLFQAKPSRFLVSYRPLAMAFDRVTAQRACSLDEIQ